MVELIYTYPKHAASLEDNSYSQIKPSTPQTKNKIEPYTSSKNTQECNWFGGWGRNRSYLYQLTGDCTHLNSPDQSKPPNTTTKPNTSWQLKIHEISQQKNEAKTIKINIYEIILSPRPHITSTFPNILEAGQRQPRRLPHKTLLLPKITIS